jgi:hypothetical protein
MEDVCGPQGSPWRVPEGSKMALRGGEYATTNFNQFFFVFGDNCG